MAKSIEIVMFKKLDAYILKKFAGTFFLMIFLFILIAVVFDISEKIDDFDQFTIEEIIFDYLQILIAYNVNLSTHDKSLANEIAGKIRTSGVIKRDDQGNKLVDSNGITIREPGKFKALQAAGWMYG